uniref:alkylated DNA repair protein alkB homolog 8 isoform X3 n=1 Tax=Myxine glutinosa TaxID=7769 RepID=UPI00358F5DC6
MDKLCLLLLGRSCSTWVLWIGELLDFLTWDEVEEIQDERVLKHRRVKHFGFEFCYEDNSVNKDHPLPGGLPAVCDELISNCLVAGYIQHRPDQLTVNRYEPGQGIPPHVDTHSAFEDGIVSLSLGSQVVMDFRHPCGTRVPVSLPARSLLVMTGDSRYLWSHGITPRKFDTISNRLQDGGPTLATRGMRISFSFRKIRWQPCHCAFPSTCDSQVGKQACEGIRLDEERELDPPNESLNRSHLCPSTAAVPGAGQLVRPKLPGDKASAERLEKAYVHGVYDTIAAHFSSTRHSPWPRVAAFVRGLPDAALLLDIGCGNGKYLSAHRGLAMIGCDRSSPLMEICHQRGFQALVCDALSLPVRSTSFDACLSIAVVHHLSTAERRHAALVEMARVLRPGGRGLVYVWALEQEYMRVRSKYLQQKRQGTRCSFNQMEREDLSSRGALGIVGGENGGVKAETGEQSSQVLATEGKRKPIPDKNEPSSIDSAAARAGKCESSENGSTVLSTGLLSIHKNRTPFSSQDVLVPWHLKTQEKQNASPAGSSLSEPDQKSVQHRFYHVFRKGELESLCCRVPDIRVVEMYYDQGNWCVIFEKVCHQSSTVL